MFGSSEKLHSDLKSNKRNESSSVTMTQVSDEKKKSLINRPYHTRSNVKSAANLATMKGPASFNEDQVEIESLKSRIFVLEAELSIERDSHKQQEQFK